jgi:hypothetical protein
MNKEEEERRELTEVFNKLTPAAKKHLLTYARAIANTRDEDPKQGKGEVEDEN